MKNAYILHGCCDKEEYFSQQYPSPSNFHWIPWLQKQLLMKGWLCQTPELPTPYKPDYDLWKTVFEANSFNEESVFIGHSCGCGFLLRWLTETGVRCKQLVLVAPWTDPARRLGTFLDFPMGADLADRVQRIDVFFSKDESVHGVKETVDEILRIFPQSHYHEFEDKGHFCLADMGTESFPELFEVVAS